jgi:hypothetical protein
MKRLGWLSLSLLLAVALIAQPVAAKVKLGVDALGRGQALESEDPMNGTNATESAGFGSMRANLYLFGDVAEGVEVFTEAHINPIPVRDALNPYPTSNPGGVVGVTPRNSTGFRRSDADRSPGDMVFDQGYITLTNLSPYFDVKAGEFEIDYGHHQMDRTDNGQSMRNPLVGNYLVDPTAVQPGLELSGKQERFAWSLGVTNGSGDLQNSIGGSDQFIKDSNFAYTAKLWGNITPGLMAAFSFYRSDQVDAIRNTSGSDTGTFVTLGKSSPRRVHSNASNLFGSMNPAGIYQGMNVTPAPVMGAFANGGADVTAWQIDLDYEIPLRGTTFEANYGVFEDNGIDELEDNAVLTLPGDIAYANYSGPSSIDNFANDQEWTYWGAQLKHPLTPLTYVAARYSTTAGDVKGVSTDLEYDKIQVGAGHKLNQNTLMKLEWVKQSVKEAPATISGTVNDSQEMGGFIAEMAVQF